MLRHVHELPSFVDCAETLSIRVMGESAFVRSSRHLTRLCLPSGEIEWVIERATGRLSEASCRGPRYINLFDYDSALWVDESGAVLAEFNSTECGGAVVSGRSVLTGALIWEYFLPVPPAAGWAEASPAWPGAQTEEIYGFFAQTSEHLVVCLMRQTRRSTIASAAVQVSHLPSYACQTDAIRLDISTGRPIWRAEFWNVPVRIMERKAFTGVWSNSPQVGMIDFKTGANTILHEFPHSLGWPVRIGTEVAVPWHSRGKLGIEWVTTLGVRTRGGSWLQPRVTRTCLHRTEAGLALQANDQSLWWLGEEATPHWEIKAAPYIYRVHRSPGTDVFVGTDGKGGRLMALDSRTGQETLSLKPARNGLGHLAKVPGHAVLVSTFGVSRSDPLRSQLLSVSMKDRTHQLTCDCFLLLGVWEHGVICRTGRMGERISVVDLRSAPSSVV